MTDCIICFEPCEKKPNNYTCKNDCFFNDPECCICDKCLRTWISYDEETILIKCPICAQHKLKDKNKILVAACDTFRAAAVDQLKEWSNKYNVDFFEGRLNQDPASVAFKACEKAKNEKHDYNSTSIHYLVMY